LKRRLHRGRKKRHAKVRHRDFPVLDVPRRYYGMISRRSFLARSKERIIRGSQEKSQAWTGWNPRILAIIDQHRLGSLGTISPVFFRTNR
jgi:manganese-dependent inorganic pyrophosphatase